MYLSRSESIFEQRDLSASRSDNYVTYEPYIAINTHEAISQFI